MKTLAMVAREKAITTLTYGVEHVELSGVIAAITGDIPDDAMQNLLKKDLRELSYMTVEELQEIPGIGVAKSMRLVAAFELARRLADTSFLGRPTIKTPQHVANLLIDQMRHLDQEHFGVLLLNTKNHVLHKKIVSVGTLNSTIIHPREIFKVAVKRSAAHIVLFHNHPSGDPTPSEEDIRITKCIVEAGKIIGIEVIDHIIIGDGRFSSIKAKGLM